MKWLFNSWITGVLLALATFLAWNHRFEVSDHPLNATVIDENFLKTIPAPRRTHCSIQETEEGPVTHLEREGEGEKGTPAIQIILHDLEDVQFIYISCDYRLKDVVPGEQSWMTAKGIFSDKMEDESSRQPSDFVLFEGSGTQDWTKLEVVRKLTGAVTDTHFYFSVGGKSGSLDFRNLRFSKVAERSWVRFVSIALALGWLSLILRLLWKCDVRNPVRAAGAGLMMLSLLWVGAFPTTITLLAPLSDAFSLDLPDVPKSPSLDSDTAISQASVSPKKSDPAEDQPRNTTLPERESPDDALSAPTPSLKENASPKKGANSGVISTQLRRIMIVLSRFHILIFALLSLFWFLLTRSVKSWPFVVALAVLPEMLAHFTFYGLDWKDGVDLSRNLSGVALGFLTWRHRDHIFQITRRAFRKQKA